MSIEAQKYFQDNDYVVIRNFVDENTAFLFYRYVINKVKRVNFQLQYAKEDFRPEWDGAFGDGQINRSYYCYGDVLMDTLLESGLTMMNDFTGLDLVPTYSYYRLYEHGDVLEKHIDRNSCEISTTLCLGYNTNNVEKNTYPDYKWPMFVETKTGETVSIDLNPGDMLIYKGCEIPHWREKYIGLNHAQVFLHYNQKDGEFNNLYDGRPILGIPKRFTKGD